MLAFPVLWQVQGKQVPEMGWDSSLGRACTHIHTDELDAHLTA